MLHVKKQHVQFALIGLARFTESVIELRNNFFRQSKEKPLHKYIKVTYSENRENDSTKLTYSY